jgi:folate-dependent phosphoribosylglycinamide formyltransferase PurN
MSVAPKRFGLLCLDRPFQRALAGALLDSLDRHGVELSGVIMLRPRSRIGRLVRGQIRPADVARFASAAWAGRANEAGIPLGLDGYQALVGAEVVRAQRVRFRKFLLEHRDRTVEIHDPDAPASIAAVRRLRLDLVLAEGCGILREPLLAGFPAGVMNLHASGPLPQYRGLGSLEFAILDRAPIVMNLHLIDAGIDTGPILAQQELPTGPGDDLPAIYAKSMRASRDFIAATVRQMLDGHVTPRPQPRDAGRQYFEPHPLIAALAERHLHRA